MRLSAMLFALHLNAAAIHSAAPASGPVGAAPLSLWVLGDMQLHFCAHPARQLLLVLVTEATLGCAPAEFLASELLRRFVACFEAPLIAAGTGLGLGLGLGLGFRLHTLTRTQTQTQTKALTLTPTQAQARARARA